MYYVGLTPRKMTLSENDAFSDFSARAFVHDVVVDDVV
jgi:hypothetical protein